MTPNKQKEKMTVSKEAEKDVREFFKEEINKSLSDFAEKIKEFIGLERYYDVQSHSKIIESEKIMEFINKILKVMKEK